MLRTFAAHLLLLALALLIPRAALGQDTLSPEELAKVKAAEEARVRTIDGVYGSVVAIYGNNRQGGGSGVIYDPAGYALTNYHVVAGAGKEGWGGLADGKLYRWKLIGMDPGGDVAIIKLAGKDKFPTSPVGDSETVRVGDFTMAMGNPFVLAEDQRPTVTLGIVSGVKRYQPGQTMTMLVYGNCIQVDSSINPGNSGGPLFNMAGEVIGINGRGSFKERGRVNVGVGYAISSEQIKNFIPDLLATKTALHGTLDAVFDDREKGVTCYQLNLDSKIAQLGLQIGDRLLSFDGQKISDANHYTNLVSTIPAGWPVEVVIERGSEEKTIWIRLPELPYGIPKKRPPAKKPDQPEPKKAEKKPPEPDDQPDEKPAPRRRGREDFPPLPDPRRQEEQVQLPDTEPGKIGDVAVNQAECRRLLALWTDHVGGRQMLDGVPAIRFRDDIVRDGNKVGTHEMLVAPSGKVSMSYQLEERRREHAFDGKKYWQRTEGKPWEPLEAADALAEQFFVHALAFARTLAADPFAGAKHFELQGSDRAQGERAYRLRANIAGDDDLVIWLSLYDPFGRPEVRLLKTAGGTAGVEAVDAMTYLRYREVAGLRLPERRRIVSELAEQPTLDFVTTECNVVQQLPDDAFGPKESAEPKK